MKNGEKHDKSANTKIYPIFLPHWGCPFQCVYCNQNATVSVHAPSPDGAADVLPYVLTMLSRLVDDAQMTSVPGEIAFYGGTFTALQRDLRADILGLATRWVEESVFSGIRFSTRPDSLGTDVCRTLSEFPIQTVELGIQSICDDVLVKSRRGYDSETVRKAAATVHDHGWDLGIQLMPGLPGDTREKFLYTVREAIALRPDFVRIYPTMVLPGTVLEEWHRSGSYTPLDLHEAIQWSVSAYDELLQAGIPIARMGLHPDLAGNVTAGPFHPSFGYLVRVHWWRDRVDKIMTGGHSATGNHSSLTLSVPDRSISEVIGPGRSNIHYWKARWGLVGVAVHGEPDLAPGNIIAVIK